MEPAARVTGAATLEYLTQDTPPESPIREQTREELLLENAELKAVIARVSLQMQNLLAIVKLTKAI